MAVSRVIVVVVGLLAVSSAAEAKRHPRPKHVDKKQAARVVAAEQLPSRGQSVGAPWAGRLREPAQLPDGDGYVIRRPWRSFGTTRTVELVERVVTGWREQFPESHVLAIGDLSAEHGGAITEHHSHQSGRDADLGLIYNEKPRGYPENFIDATEDNLDCEATYELVAAFADTSREDGGAQVMFLDFRVQGMLYRWAKDHGVEDDTLARLFQYPHGRGASAGLVRHEPNHANHVHVRFKCPRSDSSCQ
jgi:murein endopeptidase